MSDTPAKEEKQTPPSKRLVGHGKENYSVAEGVTAILRFPEDDPEAKIVISHQPEMKNNQTIVHQEQQQQQGAKEDG